MEQILLLNKNISETPLECLERFRAENPKYANVKMTYAGRLDPMASGLLIVLAGDMVHKKEEFLKLPKTYEAMVVFGIESDTFDCLGIIRPPGQATASSATRDPGTGESETQIDQPWIPDMRPEQQSHSGRTDTRIIKTLNSFIGTYSQKYPPYSSKTVNGKQLHEIARNGEDVVLPTHLVTVTEIKNISMREISRSEISRDVIPKIKAVTGDFRQNEIITSWQELPHPVSFGNHPLLEGEGYIPILLAVSFTISVSGGTYIRTIADELGKKLGTGAVLWKLHRTKVGDYEIFCV